MHRIRAHSFSEGPGFRIESARSETHSNMNHEDDERADVVDWIALASQVEEAETVAPI